VTEVKTIQQFLRKIRKDHEIVLLPMGGSQLIRSDSEAELREVFRIAGSVAALIDSERSSAGTDLAPDRAKFKSTCERIGIKCHVLERRATENYLTEPAIKKIKGEKYCALTGFEDLTKARLGWGKAENWKIAREMSWDDVKETDLGKFLEAL
jgi:hypothetical protein